MTDRPVHDPAAAMRDAADALLALDALRDPVISRIAARVADWLDEAANDVDEIGLNFRAERVAAAILGRPDPWPDARPPRRPEPGEPQ